MINRDLWLTAVKEATDVPPPASDALTIAEFAVLLGVTRNPASRVMGQLVEAGRAMPTTKEIRGRDGRRAIVTAYRLLKPEGRQCVTRHAKPKPSTGRRSATTPPNPTMKTSAREA